MGRVRAGLGSPDPEHGHPDPFTWPERGFVSEKEYTRVFISGVVMVDAAGEAQPMPVALAQGPVAAAALVEQLASAGILSARVHNPSVDPASCDFAARALSLARWHGNVPLDPGAGEQVPAMDSEAAAALGHAGAWRGHSGRRWCSLLTQEGRDGPPCLHVAGEDLYASIMPRPHWSCCGRTGVGDECTAWVGKAAAHGAHEAHRVREARMALAFICDLCGAATGRRHYRCAAGCDFDLCGGCFDRGVDAGALSVADLKALIRRGGLRADGCFEKADLVARAREAQVRLAAGGAAGGAAGEGGGAAQAETPPTSSARRAGPLGGRHTCEHCGGLFNNCFGSYGVRQAGGGWAMGASADLADRPESPNNRWCCAACETAATGVAPAAAPNPEQMLTDVAQMLEGAGHGAGAADVGRLLEGLIGGNLEALLGGNKSAGVDSALVPRIEVVEAYARDDADPAPIEEKAPEGAGASSDNFEPGAAATAATKFMSLGALAALGQEACAICQAPFEAGDVVATLPACGVVGCRAVFHRGDDGACDGGILRWLKDHTACPLCRSDMPTRPAGREAGASGGDGGDGSVGGLCFACGAAVDVEACACRTASDLRGRFAQDRPFFFEVAAAVARRALLGQASTAAAAAAEDARLLDCPAARDLERCGWRVRAPLRRLLEWSRRGLPAGPAAPPGTLPPLELLVDEAVDANSVELVRRTLALLTAAAASDGPATQGHAGSAGDGGAARGALWLVAESERLALLQAQSGAVGADPSLAEHRDLCGRLAGPRFSHLADAAAALVARGGSAAEWAALEAELGELERRGWAVRSAVALLRRGVRDGATLAGDADPRSTMLVRLILRLVLAAEGGPGDGPGDGPGGELAGGMVRATSGDARDGMLAAALDALDVAAAPSAAAAAGEGPPSALPLSRQLSAGSAALLDDAWDELAMPPPTALRRQRSVGSSMRDALDSVVASVADAARVAGAGGEEDARKAAVLCLRLVARTSDCVRGNPGERFFRLLRADDSLLARQCLRFPGAVEALRLAGWTDPSPADASAGACLALETVDLDALGRLSALCARAIAGLEGS